MSANPTITANDVVKYISQILNIDVSDRLTFQDILDDLASVNDLPLFRMFMKERFNYERFRYLTGYQKFVALLNEFKKENQLQLSEENKTKVDDYSSKLFSLITSIMDTVNFELQTKGKSIDDLDFEKTLLSSGIKNHHIEVLRAIGDKKKIFHLSVYGKEELRARIESIVHSKTMIKQYPHLALKNKKSYEGIETMEKLKLGLRR